MKECEAEAQINSPADCVQAALALVNYLAASDEGCIKKTQEALKTYILSQGGIDEIDRWLEENDPDLQQLGKITGINWNFLNE